ncbi:hypothetical protein PTSG_03309 [Salpingoeca rosetta]|uniref:Phospholipid/glycerol acyltransferase domain-containing protein n=1 Tax=Salpingoeca rosetta (strain ATCC 50818 / BSB-021) TaxID=946362 RepID=F2U4T5_SALR5|nr:uncharacterized protein PTSG_03309 [Salpingoeca rosetta]EGD82651.1 hypothetical protein PTSG_03309 [Salpingoeca rosetta]|eukprot:XP_004995887.1 hypothetical protein PTSG_03309 [Salpingoeca rosetta]
MQLFIAAFNLSAALLASIAFHMNTWNTALSVVMALVFSEIVSQNAQFYARLLFHSMLYVFFREIDTRNAHCIPKSGPVVFVCGPHASQFVDPILIITHTPRDLRFLIAAKSVKRWFVGFMARLINSIPVQRPQDAAVRGKGTVTGSSTLIVGHGTTFTKDFQVTDSIFVAGEAYRIEKIVSDTRLVLKRPLTRALPVRAKFKIFPRIDHSVAYQLVYQAFHNNECVAIFPEGGSHDRPELLPLKAGAAVMALGAMADNCKPIKVVPVGLNYFHGHRFRSRALVDFGRPIEVEPHLVEEYKAGGERRRTAIATLMSTITEALNSVTITAPDYDELRLLWAIRRLYKPEHVVLTLEQTQQLTLRFADLKEVMGEEPRFMRLLERVSAYNKQLESYGLRDHQVKRTVLKTETVISMLLWRAVLFVVELLALLPFMVLGLPILFACRLVSESKARAAVAGSSVKLVGRDVKATWKILTATAIIPIYFILYIVLAGVLFSWRAALGTFVCLPMLMLVSLRIWDHFLRVSRSFSPLLVAVFHRNAGRQLLQTRRELKHEIREVVRECADKLRRPRMFTEADFAGESDTDEGEEPCESSG